jgi:hypothetical protein
MIGDSMAGGLDLFGSRPIAHLNHSERSSFRSGSDRHRGRMRVSIVKIYDASLLKKSRGAMPSGEKAPAIPKKVLDAFEKRLQLYPYELSPGESPPRVYKYTKSKGWSLQVEVDANEIRFTAPETKSFNSSLIFECLQTASELCDSGKLAVFHVRDEEWLENGG